MATRAWLLEELQLVLYETLLGNIQCGVIKSSPVPTSVSSSVAPSSLSLHPPLSSTSPSLSALHPPSFYHSAHKTWSSRKNRLQRRMGKRVRGTQGKRHEGTDRDAARQTWVGRLDSSTSNLGVIWNDCFNTENARINQGKELFFGWWRAFTFDQFWTICLAPTVEARNSQLCRTICFHISHCAGAQGAPQEGRSQWKWWRSTLKARCC